MENERTGDVYNYKHGKNDVLFEGVFAPSHAPEWMCDRRQLWNAVEKMETYKTAQVARDFIVALPHELTTEQNTRILKDFIRDNFTRKGYVVDVAMHKPDRRGDQRNIHAHILVSMRTLNEDGSWSKKEQFTGRKPPVLDLIELRAKCCARINRELEKAGLETRWDHRDLKSQGIDRTPTQHVGKDATNLARDGQHSDRAEQLRRQREIHRLRQEADKIEQQYANENAERLTRANDDAPEIEKPRAATVEAQTAVAQSAIDRMNAEDRAAHIEALRAVGRSRWATMGDELRGIFTAVRSLAATMGGALFQIVKGGGFFQAKAEVDYAKSLQPKPQPVQTKPKQPAPAARAANPMDELKRMGEAQRAKNKQKDEQEALDELRAGISGKVRRKGPEPKL
jgi:hypothetical protein